MEEALATLRGFVSTILKEDRSFNSLEGPVVHYGVFLREILNASRPAFTTQRDINTPTQTAAGDALTPWHAAACMEDRTRTAAFIRGSIQAVESALENSTHRPLHLIEAGCGPLGTLVLPLLAHFDSDQLVVSVIDLHEESLECMKTMFEHFGFVSRVRHMICGDATAVNIGTSADIILTETMNAALSQEPQVAISRALMQQHPNAVLIPQSIQVDCALLNIQLEATQFPPQVCDRINLGTVFELNRTSAVDLEENEGLLPAARIRIPDHVEPGLSPWLTTTVQIFNESKFADYETQISHPIPLDPNGQQAISLGATLHFAYQMRDTPGVVFQVEQIDVEE